MYPRPPKHATQAIIRHYVALFGLGAPATGRAMIRLGSGSALVQFEASGNPTSTFAKITFQSSTVDPSAARSMMEEFFAAQRRDTPPLRRIYGDIWDWLAGGKLQHYDE